MEWTEAARHELERLLSQVRDSLDPSEVDIHEVTSDIRDRITAELTTRNGHIVTAENIRSAACRIGIQDLITEAPTIDTHSQGFTRSMERPKRIRHGFAAGWFWFTGIILPLVVLGIELLLHPCLDTGIADPLPTAFHAVLILLVPLANLLGWMFLRDRRSLPTRGMGLLLGAATLVALYYTLMFITITPFALIGFAAIIYFGIGLLCFLPLAPILSLAALLRMRYLIKKKTGRVLPLFKSGILLGLAAIILASSPMYLTKIGLNMAASDNPASQVKGIRLLRWIGDEAAMNRACYWGMNIPSDPIASLISGGKTVPPEQARDIYYRVTGSAFNTMASPTIGIRNRRNPGEEFDWDREQGGDVVAGRLKGLSLKDSRMDGVVNADAATAYLEWTMVFRNDWSTEREARAQIALPPGAAVSRLTLWIDGEEREAAFGGRSQVKQAYKKVVIRQRRDPVLVTTYGPDRILMQCFPVPAEGEMKVRIGITAPMDCLSQTDRSLRLPNLLERNFSIPEHVKHAVWIEDHLIADLTNAQLDSPEARVSGTSSNNICWAADDESLVVQEIRASVNEQPNRIVVVLDTSIGMEPYMAEIGEAMDSISAELPVSVWVAADGEPREVSAGAIATLATAGGQDNAQALRQALTGEGNCIVWIHAAQPWDLGSSETLRQALERSHGKQMYDVQVESGPNRLIEKMDNLNSFHTVARYGSVRNDLERLFDSFTDEFTSWQAVRTLSRQQQIPEDWTHGDAHLIRLYALDRIREDLADGNPDKDLAMELSLKHHLVTPVSGAVVLETQQQYDEANLQPVESSWVPNVPEPGTLVLLIFAVLLVFFGKRLLIHLSDRLAAR